MGINNIEISVCEVCKNRFVCFTKRENTINDCIDFVSNFTDDERKRVFIAKAKRQGHYLVGGE